MLKVHVLDRLFRHSSNVAHGVEVPAGARRLVTKIIVAGLARPELRIEIEAVAAKVD